MCVPFFFQPMYLIIGFYFDPEVMVYARNPCWIIDELELVNAPDN